MMRSFIERAAVVWTLMAAVLVGLVVVGGGSWLFWKARVVVIMLILAVLLSLLLNPVVERLVAAGCRRWLAILIVYVVLIAVVVTGFVLLVPLLIRQGIGLYHWIQQPPPEVQARIQLAAAWYQSRMPPEMQTNITKNTGEVSAFALRVVHSLFHSILEAISWGLRSVIIMVLSIYLLADRDRFFEWFRSSVTEPRRERVQELLRDMVGVLEGYLRGLALMVLFVAIAVSLLLLIARNPYWLFIGVLAGALEVIPYFGPVTGAVPGVAMAFAERGPLWGFGVLAGFVLINQLEGHVVAPAAMGHSLKIRPLSVLLALLVGAEVKGIMGMILAVPVLGIARVLWHHAARYFREPSIPGGLSLSDAAAVAMDPGLPETK